MPSQATRDQPQPQPQPQPQQPLPLPLPPPPQQQQHSSRGKDKERRRHSAVSRNSGASATAAVAAAATASALLPLSSTWGPSAPLAAMTASRIESLVMEAAIDATAEAANGAQNGAALRTVPRSRADPRLDDGSILRRLKTGQELSIEVHGRSAVVLSNNPFFRVLHLDEGDGVPVEVTYEALRAAAPRYAPSHVACEDGHSSSSAGSSSPELLRGSATLASSRRFWPYGGSTEVMDPIDAAAEILSREASRAVAQRAASSASRTSQSRHAARIGARSTPRVRRQAAAERPASRPKAASAHGSSSRLRNGAAGTSKAKR